MRSGMRWSSAKSYIIHARTIWTMGGRIDEHFFWIWTPRSCFRSSMADRRSSFSIVLYMNNANLLCQFQLFVPFQNSEQVGLLSLNKCRFCKSLWVWDFFFFVYSGIFHLNKLNGSSIFGGMYSTVVVVTIGSYHVPGNYRYKLVNVNTYRPKRYASREITARASIAISSIGVDLRSRTYWPLIT